MLYYLCLDLPEFCLFCAVHFTVDNQNIRQTSNVSRLHLKGHGGGKKNRLGNIHMVNMP